MRRSDREVPMEGRIKIVEKCRHCRIRDLPHGLSQFFVVIFREFVPKGHNVYNPRLTPGIMDIASLRDEAMRKNKRLQNFYTPERTTSTAL